MADFYAFAGAHPWLTFFLGCLAVSAIGALASFRPITINHVHEGKGGSPKRSDHNKEGA